MEYFHYNIISSTSDYTKLLLKNNNEVIVTADYQTKGRGRNQNQWLGNYGDNIYLSYGVNHSIPLNFNQAALYQAIGCLSVLSSLRKISDCDIFKIKYPNDVYSKVQGIGNPEFGIREENMENNHISQFPIPNSEIPVQINEDYKKISGILTEHGFLGENCSYSVLGIGINVNQTEFPDELKDKACSLKSLNFHVDKDNLLNLLIDEIIYFRKMNFNDIFELWLNELNIIGKIITLKNKNGNWIVKELLNDCRLLVANVNDNEQIIIDDGDSISYKL